MVADLQQKQSSPMQLAGDIPVFSAGMADAAARIRSLESDVASLKQIVSSLRPPGA